jgi:hypothetical protein
MPSSLRSPLQRSGPSWTAGEKLPNYIRLYAGLKMPPPVGSADRSSLSLENGYRYNDTGVIFHDVKESSL